MGGRGGMVLAPPGFQAGSLTAIPEGGQGQMPGGKADSILPGQNGVGAAWRQEGAVASRGREAGLPRPEGRSQRAK